VNFVEEEDSLNSLVTNVALTLTLR